VTSDELGLLVLKIQDDDVRQKDLRDFLRTITTDEEVRRNAKLVSGLSGLKEDVRTKHCLANVMVLLADSQLAPPPGDVEVVERKTTTLFSTKLAAIITGPWRKHIRPDQVLSAAELQRRMRGGRGVSAVPTLYVSDLLASHVIALEDFWGVRGTFMA
jgi:hypothetical protein